MKLFLGRDIKTKDDIYINAAGAHAILICGKRGSGKSYTLGVIVEELMASSKQNVIPIIVDPMGVYHTMSQSNALQKDLLYEWGLAERFYRVRLLLPGEPEDIYGREILEALEIRGVDVIPLRLNPSDLSPDGWCDLFGLNINRPMGIVLFRSVQNLHRKKRFSLNDIIEQISLDGRAQDTSKEALINRLEAAKLWHIFAEEGYTPIQTLFEPDTVNIVDLSQLEPGPRGRRNLTISVISRNLFRARTHARLREEFGLATPLPRIWMLIDEAHQFVPTGGSTLAKKQLVRWAKEGRQPGLSLVVASQQPSAIDSEVLSQCDIILSHKLTTRADVKALNALSQDYMGGELRTYIKALDRVGQAVLVDDEKETVNITRIRPRQSLHGGSTEAPSEEETFDIWA